MSLLSAEGFEFLVRWIHFLSGITWIGILYYFNFIQGAFLTEVEADTKKDITTKLMPRALWWFRWGAMITVIAGLIIYFRRLSLWRSPIFERSIPQKERRHMSLLSAEGFEFLVRWIHFLSGITWIGILYYFNFIQGAFLTEVEADTKKDITTKLMPRALWWFRWGAMITVIAGLIIYFRRLGVIGADTFFASSYGVSITIGGILGIIMWFNVWFIIWPNQKKIIAAAKGESSEGGNARVAFLASRTNTMLSIPMLFFMAAASHMPWTG